MTMEKPVIGATTTKFSSNQPPDVAKSTSFTTRPQLRKFPLQWIQSVVAKSTCWNSTHANYFAIRPQLRRTPLRRKPPVLSKTNLATVSYTHLTLPTILRV